MDEESWKANDDLSSTGAEGTASTSSILTFKGSVDGRSRTSATQGSNSKSLPSSRSSSPGGGEIWGQNGQLTSYVKIEGIDYPFDDGSYYDQIAKNALKRSIRDSLREIILLGVPDKDCGDKEERQLFERRFCLEKLREVDAAITFDDINYYKKFNCPRRKGKPKHMAVGMEEEEVAQALLTLAERNGHEEVKRSWLKIQRVNGKAYAYKKVGNGKIEIFVHPNPDCMPEYIIEHPFPDDLAAKAEK